MLPVIAIVGRPNVGKSTLFNRLTRTRHAIVSDFPGTTRDRQYGQLNYPPHRAILIDTGGITESAYTDQTGLTNKAKQTTDRMVDSFITQQALNAIQDATAILFLIDGKAGIMPEDKLIATEIRQTGKPIYLVVNKGENQQPDLFVAEAFELGLGQPYAISSAHGTGIDALLQAMLPNNITTQETEANAATSIKLAVIGRPNVGKSTMINRMLGENRMIVHDSPGTTRDSIYVDLERHDQHYTLIDTAGVRKRGKIHDAPEKFSVVKALQAIEDAHVVIFVIDARRGIAEHDLKLLGFIIENGKGLVIAVNKWDDMTVEDRERVKHALDLHLDFVPFARTHFVSALHGSGIGNLFTSVDEAYESAHRKLSTPALTRLLQKATETHQPPLVQGRRIKLRYAHAGGQNPPKIIIHGKQLQDLPGSYKRYLSHFFQKQLKLYGTPVFIEFKTDDNPYD